MKIKLSVGSFLDTKMQFYFINSGIHIGSKLYLKLREEVEEIITVYHKRNLGINS